MARYTSQNEFMHNFAAGATSSIPMKNRTSTWFRAEKREQARIDDFSERIAKATQSATKINEKDDKARAKIYRDIFHRVQKQHPEMSRIQAQIYTKHRDPEGRKYARLERQGYSAKEIAKALNGGGSHSSSGHRGG